MHQALLLLHAGPVQSFIMSGHHGPRYLECPSARGIIVCEDSVAFGRARNFFLRTTKKLRGVSECRLPAMAYWLC